MKLFLVIMLIFLNGALLLGQELQPGADLVSRYIWRGKDFGNSPAIQPGLTYTWNDFSIGAWGSLTINDNIFQEQDLFVSYTLFDVFTFGVTDYFFPNDTISDNKYFHYKKEETGHTFELNVKIHDIADIAAYIAFNYNFYGADTANSSYLELGYKSKLKDIEFDAFMGFALDKGIYGNSFGVVYLGLTGYKNIKITEEFSLPVFSRLIFNPQAENIHLVFGLTF